MSHDRLGSRQFTLEDQMNFAGLSGDSNPLHLDPVAARRTIYGDVVVHGVHLLLWALDCLAATSGAKGAWSHLKTDFKRQIRLGDMVSCELTESEEDRFALRLKTDGEMVAQIKGLYSDAIPNAVVLPGNASSGVCRDLTFDQMTKASGSLPLYLDEPLFQKLFPALSRFFPALQISEILATTRLVGMECPGLHSLYSGLDLTFHGNGGPAEISYQVTRSDARFSLLWLTVSGPGMSGMITAFARPCPRAQAGMAAVSRVVQRGEFAGQRALIIGGSRGLGEVAAKIIAAGGGDVRLTYHRGKADAERVADEIHVTGARCECLAFDVTNPADLLVPGVGAEWAPTHLYYFATPLISLEKSRPFSPDRFHHYCRFYVDGFSRAVAAALQLGSEQLGILYPSTIFLDHFHEHTAEYCAAKAAGELLCGHLEKTLPKIRVHCPRLPRMDTDQTSSLMPAETTDPLEILLDEIRRMQRSAERSGPPKCQDVTTRWK